MMIEYGLLLLVVLLGYLLWKKQKRVVELEAKEKVVDEQLVNTFKALSSDALDKSSKSFLDLAKLSFDPVKESLSKLDKGMQALEKERKGDHSALTSQVKALVENEKELRSETSSLVKALRAPVTRGRWGEIQLRRVVELAGMLNQCDFFEQEAQGALRPDLLVRLPGGRQIVIDAKVPLDAYLDSLETDNIDIKKQKLKEHARKVREHVQVLSRKAYWEQFQPSPEFVILFLPSEAFFGAALEADSTLIEVGAEKGVIIATPTTLIALLRTVAYGWKQENLSRHAEKVSELGHELYKRIVDMTGHISKLGRALNTATDTYNKTVGSFESRVLVSARKFQELGAAASTLDLNSPEILEKLTREVTPHSPAD